LLQDLQGKQGAALVQALAKVQPATSLPALATSIASASRVNDAIDDNNWALLQKVWGGGEAAGLNIKQAVVSALETDELVTPLAAALRRAQQDATALVTSAEPKPSKPEPAPTPPSQPAGRKILKQGKRQGLSGEQARELLDEIRAGLDADAHDAVSVDISYTITGEAADGADADAGADTEADGGVER